MGWADRLYAAVLFLGLGLFVLGFAVEVTTQLFANTYVRAVDLAGTPKWVRVLSTPRGPRLIIDESVTMFLMSKGSNATKHWGKLSVFDPVARRRLAVVFVPRLRRCLGVALEQLWCVDDRHGLTGRDLETLDVRTSEEDLFRSNPHVRTTLTKPRFDRFRLDEPGKRIGVETRDGRLYEIDLATRAIQTVRHFRGSVAEWGGGPLSGLVDLPQGRFQLEPPGDGVAHLLHDLRPTSDVSLLDPAFLRDTATGAPLVFTQPPSLIVEHARSRDDGRMRGLLISRLRLDGQLVWTYRYPGIQSFNRRYDQVPRILAVSATDAGLLLVLQIAGDGLIRQVDLVLLDPKTGQALWQHALSPLCGTQYPFLCQLLRTNLN